MTRPSKKLSKQLNKAQDGLSNNKKREGAANDIARIVKAHNALAEVSNREFDQIARRLDDMTITLQSIGNIIGVEAVQAESKKLRIKILEDESLEKGKKVAEVYAAGGLVKTLAATDKSLIVASICQADGTVAYPSKHYLTWGSILPEVQAILLGKGVGETLQLPTASGTITILELYEETTPDMSKEMAEQFNAGVVATSGLAYPAGPVTEVPIQEAEFVEIK